MRVRKVSWDLEVISSSRGDSTLSRRHVSEFAPASFYDLNYPFVVLCAIACSIQY